MLSQWILYLFLPLCLPLSFRSLVLAGEKLKESRQPGTGTVVQQLSRSSQKFNKGGLTPGNTLIVPENADSPGAPLSWPITSFEESDRQGVFGEYTDTQESLETSDLGDNEEGLTTQTDSANGDATSEAGPQRQEPSSEGATPPPSYQQTSNYESEEDSSLANGSLLRPTFPARQNATLNKHLPLFLPGPLPSDGPSQSESPPYSGTVPSSKHSPPPVATGRMGSTTGLSVTTQGKVEQQTIAGVGNAHVTGDVLENEADKKAENDDPKGDDQELSMNQRESLPSGYEDTSVTPCRTSNHTWPPVYLDDFTPNESLRPSLALSPPLFVPLYSDWNSALAAWGFAWEAHIYGVGSIFSVFGLISVVCLLGLPLRCPAGSPYLTLLHLFLLAFAGIQAFCLLYDAYSHQDRLPPLIALLLSQLPFPCLTSAFSLAFLILSLRSRRRLSLPLALSSSFSALPKPCLLLCMCLLHFGVALGCVGILQLFHSLPAMILLLPQSMFVCLAIFLSFSYLISYCLIRVNTKHIYRLNDNCESGGSPEARQSASCPFAKVEDWGRAAGAGVWASLCLLGCGGLQLYGVLHSLGFGGVEGYGFLPWPWWGYQIGCRLCEAGVCLGLSLIGTHPLFCHHSSIKTISHPRPGSWSRLSCSSPSRGLTLPSQGGVSPILSTHDSWSQSKQDKMVVCDIITKRRSEALPLSSVADPPGNGLDCAPKLSRTWTTLPPLPTPPSPPHKLKNPPESQLSSLNSLDLEADSTVDLRPPSPIDLSRSIDQALYSESLFSHSIFGLPRLFHASSSHSLSSPNQGAQKSGPSTTENSLYRTSSCGDMDQENNMLSTSRPSQPQGSLKSHNTGVTSPEPSDWKGSTSGSTMGLCSKPKETGKLRSHSWANRGQNFAQSSLPRAIPHLSYHRRYRTLSLASQDSQGSGRLAGTKNLSESKQLEWDMAVQAEFVNVCRQIDALSVCSDTIEL